MGNFDFPQYKLLRENVQAAGWKCAFETSGVGNESRQKGGRISEKAVC